MTPPNSSEFSSSRRSFIKTSVLTVGAATFLSDGVALAQILSPQPQPQPKKNWYLVCTKDPGTTGNGPYGMEDPDTDGEDGHDGKFPIRKFYKRKKEDSNGGDLALFLEVRARGPVQCARDANGMLTPTPGDLRSSINITDAVIWAGVTAENPETNRWLDFLEEAQVFNDFESGDPSLSERKESYHVVGLTSLTQAGYGSLFIDKVTGEVTYDPDQVVPVSCSDGFERGLSKLDHRVQALGVVKPKILVEAVAGFGEEAKIKWNFGVEGQSNGAKVVGAMEWTNEMALVTHTLQWVIWRAYRVQNANGTEGPIVMVGPATHSNEVEIVAPPSLERR